MSLLSPSSSSSSSSSSSLTSISPLAITSIQSNTIHDLFARLSSCETISSLVLMSLQCFDTNNEMFTINFDKGDMKMAHLTSFQTNIDFTHLRYANVMPTLASLTVVTINSSQVYSLPITLHTFSLQKFDFNIDDACWTHLFQLPNLTSFSMSLDVADTLTTMCLVQHARKLRHLELNCFGAYDFGNQGKIPPPRPTSWCELPILKLLATLPLSSLIISHMYFAPKPVHIDTGYWNDRVHEHLFQCVLTIPTLTCLHIPLPYTFTRRDTFLNNCSEECKKFATNSFNMAVKSASALSLRELNLRGVGGVEFVSCFSSFSSSSSSSSFASESIITMANTLTSVNLEDTSTSSSQFHLHRVLETCTKLIDLEVVFPLNFSQKNLFSSYFSRVVPNIKRLDLRRWNGDLPHIFNLFPSLTHLDLPGCTAPDLYQCFLLDSLAMHKTRYIASLGISELIVCIKTLQTTLQTLVQLKTQRLISTPLIKVWLDNNRISKEDLNIHSYVQALCPDYIYETMSLF